MDEFYNMLRRTIQIIFSWPNSFEFQSPSLAAANMIFDQSWMTKFLQGRPRPWIMILLNETRGILHTACVHSSGDNTELQRLPSLEVQLHCLRKAHRFLQDPSHPGHSLLERLRTGWHFWTTRKRTNQEVGRRKGPCLRWVLCWLWYECCMECAFLLWFVVVFFYRKNQ